MVPSAYSRVKNHSAERIHWFRVDGGTILVKNMYFHKYPDSCGRCLRLRPHVSRYFWIRNFFFADTASVHTYPENPAEESAKIFLIRTPEWKFLNTLWIRNRVDAKSGYFFFQWRNKIEPSSLPWILYLRWQPRSQVLSLTRQGTGRSSLLCSRLTHRLNHCLRRRLLDYKAAEKRVYKLDKKN